MPSPGAACTGIGLDIDPNCIVEVSGDIGKELIDLSSGIFAPAREHVSICLEASSLDVG